MTRRTLALVIVVLVLACSVGWLASRAVRREEARARALSAAERVDSRESDATSAIESADIAPTAATTRRESGAASVAPSALPTDELAGARWVEGRVVFPPGTPFDESVEVVARGRDFPSGRLQRAHVASDGRFRVAFAPGTELGTLGVEAHYLYLESACVIDFESPPANVELAPKIGGRIIGRLVPSARAAEKFAALRQAAVYAHPSRNHAGIVDGEASVGDRLQFDLGGLDPESTWTLLARDAGVPLAVIGDELRVVGGETLHLDAPIGLGARIAGRVRGEGGVCPENAAVKCTTLKADGAPSVTWEYTDTDGSFAATVEPGTIRVTVQCAGYARRNLDPFVVAEGDKRTDVDIVLDRGHTLGGVARWPDGAPARNVSVKAHEVGGAEHTLADGNFAGYEGRDVTGENGAFRIGGLDIGIYAVDARGAWPNTAPAETDGADSRIALANLERVEADSNHLEIVMQRALTLIGRVVDERGEPVELCDVYATSGSTRVTGDREFSPGNPAVRGRFRLDGLTPGRWTIHAERTDGGIPSEKLIVNLPDQRGPIELVCRHGARIEGRVLSARGDPIDGARISVRRDPMTTHERAEPDQMNGRDAYTNADGRFQLETRAIGALQVIAFANGFAPTEPVNVNVESGGVVQVPTLTLQNGATIEGEVRGPGALPDAHPRIVMRSLADVGFKLADDTGHFRFDHVTPGRITLELAWQFVDGSKSDAAGVDGARRVKRETTSETLDVRDGETVHVVFDTAQAK